MRIAGLGRVRRCRQQQRAHHRRQLHARGDRGEHRTTRRRLLFLPATLIDGGIGLGIFAVFYGLDWIATVPPTVKLTTEAFGRENTGVVYGWIGASHQLGASMAAFGAGAIRSEWATTARPS